MQAPSSPHTAHHPSVLDKAAAAYWHAYQTGAPIGDGVAYDKQLRALKLDGSVQSLGRLEQLLAAIKQHLAERGAVEATLIAEPAMRNFVLFVAFYIGRLAAQALAATPTWQSLQQLQAQYPQADFVHGDAFYYAGAMLPMTSDRLLPVPFFALTHVGAALFEGAHVHPITRAPATGNLSAAIASYVQSVKQWQARQAAQTQTPQKQAAQVQAQTAQTQTTPKAQSSANPSVNTTAAQAQQTQTPTKITPKLSPKPVKKDSEQNDQTVFGEVSHDLKNLPAANTTAQAEYEQAVAIVDKFNEILAKKIAAGEEEIVFGQAQIEMLQRAVARIQKIAEMGNTNALLSLSLCYFKGIAMPQDLDKGVEAAFKAAERHDMRAYKFLSRLYYQGVGVEQSTEQGEKWLARAAQGGHPEAQRIQEQLMRIKVMQDDFRVEAKQDKRYMLWGVALGVLFLLLLWLMTKLTGTSA